MGGMKNLGPRGTNGYRLGLKNRKHRVQFPVELVTFTLAQMPLWEML